MEEGWLDKELRTNKKFKEEHDREMFIQTYTNYLMVRMEDDRIEFNEDFSDKLEKLIERLYKP